jgi:hypothetical protein
MPPLTTTRSGGTLSSMVVACIPDGEHSGRFRLLREQSCVPGWQEHNYACEPVTVSNEAAKAAEVRNRAWEAVPPATE